jgi:hypothetical protein
MRSAAWSIVILSGVFLAALVVVEAAGPAVGVVAVRVPPTAPENGAVLTIDHDGFRYTYHLVTAAEALFDLSRDPDCLENLLRERPRMGWRFREMLRAREDVRDLAELRGRYRAEIEGLRALGYL